MKKRFTRRTFIKAAGASAAVLSAPAILGSAGRAQGGWPDKPLTFIVPFGNGGSTDRYMRAVQPYIEKEFGQPATIVNKPGASAMIGHNYFLQQRDDGYTLLCTSASIYLPMNIVVMGAQFKLDDFAFINLPQQNSSALSASPESPYHSLEEIVKAIRAKPGTISIASTVGSAHDLNLTLLLDSLGLTREDVRIVNYPGGGDIQVALGGGVVDAGAHAAESALGSEQFFRPLVVFSRKPVKPFENAPLVDAAVTALGGKPQWIQGSIAGFAAHKGVPEKHPERWQRLVDGFKAIGTNADAEAKLQAQSLTAAWIGPEESTKLMNDSFAIIEKYKQYLMAS
ncbi:Bug family tripartite tricarboxylate transporter substrate binding protein [Propylenella binzhouense]|uniref:Tripartite tricarboxylate transporter substrate binding protein n=1 Tax=Propylenella binzhouense TaxID=2555902 RepID=A0A964T282_9HYPH|nr:tripartite tricarboxylate transporter substrate binding protein [Propylenella binzhouense]MYZ46589.1 tripartite tricarboxylate transporter substrate binding protein [Propylenella binzhouense]